MSNRIAGSLNLHAVFGATLENNGTGGNLHSAFADELIRSYEAYCDRNKLDKNSESALSELALRIFWFARHRSNKSFSAFFSGSEKEIAQRCVKLAMKSKNPARQLISAPPWETDSAMINSSAWVAAMNALALSPYTTLDDLLPNTPVSRVLENRMWTLAYGNC